MRIVLCILALVLISGCGSDRADTPSSPSSPSATPAFSLRVSEGVSNRSGTNLHEPPWVSYSSCGQIANIGTQPATWSAEMTIYGPDDIAYVTEAGAGHMPRRFEPGGTMFGCGLTTVRDFDSTHLQAVKDPPPRELHDRGRPHGHDRRHRTAPRLRSRHAGNRDQRVFVHEDRVAIRINSSSSSMSPHRPSPCAAGSCKVSSRSFEVEVGTISRLPDVVTINPGCFYLLTATTPPSSSTFGTYSGSVPGDAQMRPWLKDAGGVALRTQSGQVVDQVGLGTNTVFKEGAPLPPFGGADTDHSYERTGPDTGDNSRDFRLQSPSTPRNSQTCR